MAETTIVLTADALSLAPDRAELFRWLKCPEDLPAHRAFLEAWDEARACFERLCAPLCLAHLTPEEQATVFLTAGAALEAEVERCLARGGCALEAGVFRPVKSMLFCLDTTPTPCHGQAAHDCSRCRMQHCPYRRLRTQSIGSSTHNQTEDRRP